MEQDVDGAAWRPDTAAIRHSPVVCACAAAAAGSGGCNKASPAVQPWCTAGEAQCGAAGHRSQATGSRRRQRAGSSCGAVPNPPRGAGGAAHPPPHPSCLLTTSGLASPPVLSWPETECPLQLPSANHTRPPASSTPHTSPNVRIVLPHVYTAAGCLCSFPFIRPPPAKAVQVNSRSMTERDALFHSLISAFALGWSEQSLDCELIDIDLCWPPFTHH